MYPVNPRCNAKTPFDSLAPQFAVREGSRPQRGKKLQVAFSVGVGVLLSALLAWWLSDLSRKRPSVDNLSPPDRRPAHDEARELLDGLIRRAQGQPENPAALRRELHDFRLQFLAYPDLCVQAADELRRLPSPLDALRSEHIPE